VRRIVSLVVLGLVLVGCATDPRATRLGIQTEPASSAVACDLSALAPVRIDRDGDDMVFVGGTGARVSIIWPLGFAAWLEYGEAVLYARDGSVVGREGDVLDTIGGAADDDGFHVCKVGVRTYS
jgi:hypothetical protein